MFTITWDKHGQILYIATRLTHFQYFVVPFLLHFSPACLITDVVLSPIYPYVTLATPENWSQPSDPSHPLAWFLGFDQSHKHTFQVNSVYSSDDWISPPTFSETKPEMVPRDLSICFQGLATWFRAKSCQPWKWFESSTLPCFCYNIK